jgi:flagellar motor switch protein FliN
MTAFEEIAHIADIPVTINVELDRVIMTVRDVLALDAGSIIRTARAAGDNISISFGGAAIGSGEIVILDETVGVRITNFNEEV